KQMFQDPDGVNERLNKCLLCGSCAANCPSGVSVLEIFIKARGVLTGYKGLSPAKRVALRGMLARPGLFDRCMEWAAKLQEPFTKTVNPTVGASCARIGSPLLSGRHFKPLAKVPFHKQISTARAAAARPRPGGGPRVAFFVGCLLDKVFPGAARASVTALEHHGVDVFIPGGQGCCGIPALSAGDREVCLGLMRHNFERFKADEFDFLVTSCATCTSTIKKLWPMTARDTPLQQQAEALAEKTLDIHQLLVQEVGLDAPGDPGPSPTRVAYHDPCHLKKSLGVAAEPRAVLNASSGFRLTEMADADVCCGMGGSFNLQYYDISSEIGQLKRDAIQASGAAIVAAGCPACMMQISDMLSRAGDDIAVRHPIELYVEGLGKA
ncbi:MAG: (Fe-S)-binding protein, partial [Desulfobacterales bacterium]|nr:(Fe-S)-binding protein [Desulfobacterales bacterium]